MVKIIKNILFVLVIAILSLALICTVGLRLFGFQFRAVLSGSMEPELPVGAMLLVKRTPLEKIKVGDDITFVRDEKLTVVTHRVIAIDFDKQKLTTQGIANNTSDAPVNYENVLGKVRFSVPRLGYAISYLTTKQGKIISVTVIVALVIIWLMLGLIVPKKEKKNKRKKSNDVQLGAWIDKMDDAPVLGSWLSAMDDGSFDK